MVWDSQNPAVFPALVGWRYASLEPTGDVTAIDEPHQTGLAAYRVATGRLRMAQMDLPGEVYGMVENRPALRLAARPGKTRLTQSPTRFWCNCSTAVITRWRQADDGELAAHRPVPLIHNR
jgi:hypothetical protein